MRILCTLHLNRSFGRWKLISQNIQRVKEKITLWSFIRGDTTSKHVTNLYLARGKDERRFHFYTFKELNIALTLILIKFYFLFLTLLEFSCFSLRHFLGKRKLLDKTLWNMSTKSFVVLTTLMMSRKSLNFSQKITHDENF